jgi:hypothetical protein
MEAWVESLAKRLEEITATPLAASDHALSVSAAQQALDSVLASTSGGGGGGVKRKQLTEVTSNKRSAFAKPI